MASHVDESGFDSVLRALVARRLVVYAGGLAVIVLPRVLRAALGIEVPAAIRTVVIVVGLGAMILTYLGERRVDGGTDTTTDRKRDAQLSADDRASSRPERASGSGSEPTSTPVSGSKSGYSRRTRTTVAIGLAGIAIGIYVAIEVDTIVGVLFVVGGLLFGQSAVRNDSNREEEN